LVQGAFQTDNGQDIKCKTEIVTNDSSYILEAEFLFKN